MDGNGKEKRTFRAVVVAYYVLTLRTTVDGRTERVNRVKTLTVTYGPLRTVTGNPENPGPGNREPVNRKPRNLTLLNPKPKTLTYYYYVTNKRFNFGTVRERNGTERT